MSIEKKKEVSRFFLENGIREPKRGDFNKCETQQQASSSDSRCASWDLNHFYAEFAPDENCEEKKRRSGKTKVTIRNIRHEGFDLVAEEPDSENPQFLWEEIKSEQKWIEFFCVM